jgi:hypothetical protein
MAMTWEQAQPHVDQMAAQHTTMVTQINQLMSRADAADAEHRRMHAELEQTKAQLTQANAAGGRGEFRLIDPKSMIPDKLDTSKTPWRQWAESTRAYVSMLSPLLSTQLKKVEGLETKLTTEDIQQAAVPEHHAAQMTRFLLLQSVGNANTLIKASMERNEHPLETWRSLSWEYDPKGLGTELLELSDLVSPNKLRAKTLADISMAIESWEAMERRHKERQGIALDEKIRISILFQLVPEKLAQDILKQTTKWTSYTALRDHLHTLQHLRTSGAAPMITTLKNQLKSKHSQARK